MYTCKNKLDISIKSGMLNLEGLIKNVNVLGVCNYLFTDVQIRCIVLSRTYFVKCIDLIAENSNTFKCGRIV